MLPTRAIVAAGAALILSGCDPQAGMTNLQKEAVRADEVKPYAGATRMFGAVPETIAGANQFGFRAGAYAPTGGDPAWRVVGNPIFVSGTSAPRPNRVHFDAYGAAGDAFDTIRFAIDLTDERWVPLARPRFHNILRGFVAQSRVRDMAVLRAVLTETPTTGAVDGIPVAITVTPIEGQRGARRVTVTFSRPGATSAVNPPISTPPTGNMQGS